jgi:hypothetical protein
MPSDHPVALLDAMHLRSMIHHLVPSWKRSITATLTAIAFSNPAPECRLFGRMSPVVVSIEVIPAPIFLSLTFRVKAEEDKAPAVVDGLDGAHVRYGRRDERNNVLWCA